MKPSKRAIKAIAYNLIFPGSGYFYIGAKDRYLFAVVLIYITIYELIGNVGKLADGKGELYFFNITPLIPGTTFVPLVAVFAVLLAWDTYRLTQKLPAKPKSQSTIADPAKVLSIIIKNIMRSPKRTKIAIALNILLPGMGYFYIRAKKRYLLATFLLGSAMYVISQIITYFSAKPASTITISPYFLLFVVAPLGIIFIAMVIADTFYLAQRLRAKSRS